MTGAEVPDWAVEHIANGAVYLAYFDAVEWRDAEGRSHREDGPSLVREDGRARWCLRGRDIGETQHALAMAAEPRAREIALGMYAETDGRFDAALRLAAQLPPYSWEAATYWASMHEMHDHSYGYEVSVGTDPVKVGHSIELWDVDSRRRYAAVVSGTAGLGAVWADIVPYGRLPDRGAV